MGCLYWKTLSIYLSIQVAAEDVPNAFLMMYIFQSACETQVMAQAGNLLFWVFVVNQS